MYYNAKKLIVKYTILTLTTQIYRSLNFPNRARNLLRVQYEQDPPHHSYKERA